MQLHGVLEDVTSRGGLLLEHVGGRIGRWWASAIGIGVTHQNEIYYLIDRFEFLSSSRNPYKNH